MQIKKLIKVKNITCKLRKLIYFKLSTLCSPESREKSGWKFKEKESELALGSVEEQSLSALHLKFHVAPLAWFVTKVAITFNNLV